MKGWQETRGPVFELTRHFVARMFDSELFATSGRWRGAAIGAFCVLPVAGLIFQDPHMVARYHRLAPTAMLTEEAGRMLLFLAIAGLLAVFHWEALLPGRRDYLGLASLPVRPRQVFLARFLALSIFAVGAVAALIALPSMLAPHAAARVTASALACFFALFSMVALQAALLNLLPNRVYARVSAYVQGLSATAFFLMALESWHLGNIPDLLSGYAWAPPVWFVALDHFLAGDAAPSFQPLALRALIAFSMAVTLALAGYFLSYWRYRSLLLEGEGAVATSVARRWNVTALLVRNPQRLAVLDFMDKTLARSRTHRLVLLGYGGMAFGFLINSVLLALAAAHWDLDWNKIFAFMTLYWPLTASMVLIPGMRHAMSLPVELGANWIFRINESSGRTQWMRAVETFVALYAIAPVYILLAPAAVLTLGWGLALRMATMQAFTSLAIFEMLFYSWQQLPYAPGKKPLASIVGRYLAAVFFLAPVLSILIATVSRLTSLFIFYAVAFAGFWLWMRRRRREGWGEARLIYEDDPEALADLGLRG